MNFYFFLRILRKRIWILIILPIVSVPAVVLLTANLPQKFASYLLISTGLSNIGVSLDENIQRFAVLTHLQQVNNILELAKSRSVFQQTGYKLLHHDLTSERPFRQAPQEKQAISKEDQKKATVFLEKVLAGDITKPDTNAFMPIIKGLLAQREYDHDDIRKTFKIVMLEGSDFIRISSENEHPVLVAYSLNTMAEIFISIYKNLMAGESIRMRRFFEKQVSSSKKKLKTKEEELKEFKVEHNIIQISEQIKSVIAQISSFENLQNDITQEIEILKATIWKIESQLSNFDGALETHNLILLNNKVMQATEELKQLEKEFIIRKYENEEDNLDAFESEIKAKQIALKELVNKLWLGHYIDPQESRQTLVLRLINSKIELEVARATQKIVTERLENFRKNSIRLTPIEATISKLNREIEVAEQEYLQMLDKLNLARAFESNTLSSNNLKVVEHATIPEEPLSSKRLLLIILAGMGSFMFGVVSTFIIEYLDINIRTVTQVERAISHPVAITIPQIQNIEKILQELQYQPGDFKDALLKESFRRLRHQIIAQIGNNQSILVTSFKIDEGKTFVAASLGIILATAKYKTLIIDANFRNPSLAKIFKVEYALTRSRVTSVHPDLDFVLSQHHQEYNFQELLQNDVYWQDVVLENVMPNVDLLCAKSSFYNPFELNGADKLNKVLTDLKGYYDFLVIDSPALNFFADAAELSQMVDGTLLVFKAGEPFKEPDKNSLEQLNKAPSKKLGIVFNRIESIFMDSIYDED